MPLIINEIEIIAPPPEPATRTNQTSAPARPPIKTPTPKADYWVLRKLTERRLRLLAR